MKRDMDYVRSILIKIEDGQDWFQTEDESEHSTDLDVEPLSDEEKESIRKTDHHLRIMSAAGLIELGAETEEGVFVKGLTWNGHDFLDSVRDPAVWRKTKDGASKLGGAGFSMIIEYAKAVAKSELQKLGLPIP